MEDSEYDREIALLNGQIEVDIDDIMDLLFTMLGDSEELSLKWMFNYNTALEARPVDLVENNKLIDIYKYLHYSVYGPY
jgi:hypothetical protein